MFHGRGWTIAIMALVLVGLVVAGVAFFSYKDGRPAASDPLAGATLAPPPYMTGTPQPTVEQPRATPTPTGVGIPTPATGLGDG